MSGSFAPELAARIESAISPTGVLGFTTEIPSPEGSAPFYIYGASVGEIGVINENARLAANGNSTRGTLDGAGGATDREDARLLAAAEAIERYSSCTYDERQFRWATERKIGESAVPLASLPRISAAEEAASEFWRTPDPDAPIRWVKALSLNNGEEVWLPAILTYLHLPFASEGERFSAPISTGCAIHSDPLLAVANGLMEVIERDAISLTWLQMLRLPLLSDDRLKDEAVIDSLRDSSKESTTLTLFDATTDLGVPTVYGIDVSPWSDAHHTVVAAVTSHDFDSAVRKIRREVLSCRIALQSRRSQRTDPSTFIDVHDGALFMGSRERYGAFNFLTGDVAARGRQQPLRTLPSGEESPVGLVTGLLDAVESAGMTAYAVDLTSREARQLGLFACKVVVPELMPLSFVRQAQFRGSRRLYEAPASMGYTVRTEGELNSWPQPFA